MIRSIRKSFTFIHFGLSIEQIEENHPEVDELLKKIVADATHAHLQILPQLGWVGTAEGFLYVIVIYQYAHALDSYCTSVYKGKKEAATGHFHVEQSTISLMFPKDRELIDHTVIFYHVTILCELCLKEHKDMVVLPNMRSLTQREAHEDAFKKLGKVSTQEGFCMWDLSDAKSTN